MTMRAAYKAQEKFQLIMTRFQRDSPQSNKNTISRIDLATSLSSSLYSLDTLTDSSSSGAWELSLSSALSPDADKKDKKKRNRRTVRFDDNVQIEETLSRQDWSLQEKQNAFYSDVEQYCMKVAATADADDEEEDTTVVNNSSSNSNSNNKRGLENMTNHGRIRYEVRLQGAVCAVLDEQHRQRCNVENDAQLIARASQQVTAFSVAEARQRALLDQQEARAATTSTIPLAPHRRSSSPCILLGINSWTTTTTTTNNNNNNNTTAIKKQTLESNARRHSHSHRMPVSLQRQHSR